MKYLIFSDTHLSGYSFDQNQYDKLVEVISTADRVIINGDFFDAYLSTFNDFYLSQWSQLFPLLKKKKAIYIYGNHDRPEYMDERVTDFSVEQTYRKEITLNNKAFIVQHGQSFAPDFDGRFPSISYYLAWFYPRYFYHEQNDTWFNKLFIKHYIGNKNKFIHGELKKSIEYLKKRNPSCKNQWFICGHSHIAEHNQQLKFVNTGLFRRGFAEYAFLEESGKIRLITDAYPSDLSRYEKLAKAQTRPE